MKVVMVWVYWMGLSDCLCMRVCMRACLLVFELMCLVPFVRPFYLECVHPLPPRQVAPESPALCVFLLQHRQLWRLPHHQRHVRTHECKHVEPGGRGQVSTATQRQRAMHLHDGLSAPRLTTPGAHSHRGTGLAPLLDSTRAGLCRGALFCPDAQRCKWTMIYFISVVLPCHYIVTRVVCKRTAPICFTA